MKTCTKCNTEKDESEFGKEKKGKDGYCSQCKKCKSSSDKKYFKSNIQKIKLKNKRYRIENIDKLKEYQIKWWEKNSLIKIETATKWRRENPEKSKESNKKYDKKSIAECRSVYIKKLLAKAGYPKEFIEQTPELIELHKLQIKFKRLLYGKAKAKTSKES